MLLIIINATNIIAGHEFQHAGSAAIEHSPKRHAATAAATGDVISEK